MRRTLILLFQVMRGPQRGTTGIRTRRHDPTSVSLVLTGWIGILREMTRPEGEGIRKQKDLVISFVD